MHNILIQLFIIIECFFLLTCQKCCYINSSTRSNWVCIRAWGSSLFWYLFFHLLFMYHIISVPHVIVVFSFFVLGFISSQSIIIFCFCSIASSFSNQTPFFSFKCHPLPNPDFAVFSLLLGLKAVVVIEAVGLPIFSRLRPVEILDLDSQA